MKSYPYADAARMITNPAALSEFCYRSHRNPLGGAEKVIHDLRKRGTLSF